MTARTLLIVGGTGFIGSRLAQSLTGAGWRLLIPTRRRARAAHLLHLPTADVIEADVHDPARLAGLVAQADAVVNLVGVLHSPSGTPYGPAFAKAHVELPARLAQACRQAGVGRLIHVSALGAGADAPSEYQRSKAAGEAALIDACGDALDWTVFRPSVVFGPGDSFLNLFASLARLFPVLPLGGAYTRFQPVFVGDVVAALRAALDQGRGVGEVLELAGPEVYTLADLVRLASTAAGHPRPVLPLPAPLAWLQATVLSWLPGAIMSPDNLRSMQRDNVASGTPLPFGLEPTPLEAVLPGWLGGRTERARLYPLRANARRN